MVVDSAVANSPAQAAHLSQRRNRTPAEQPLATPTARPLMLVPTHRNAPVTPLVLTSTRQWIGSDSSCQFQLRIPGIAERHVLILLNSHEAAFRSWDHRTWLNGHPTQQGRLKPGDELTVGPLQFRVELPQELDLIEHLPAIPAEPVEGPLAAATDAAADSPAADSPAADSPVRDCAVEPADLERDWMLRELVLREQQQEVLESWNQSKADQRQIERAEQELRKAQEAFAAQCRQREQQLEQLETRLSERADRLAATEAELRCRRDELTRQEESCASGRTRIEAEQSQLATQQLELQSWQKQLDEQQSQLESEQQNLTAKIERLTEQERAVERQREQAQQTQRELEQREQAIEQLAAVQQATRDELDSRQVLLVDQSRRFGTKLLGLRQMLEEAREELEQERQKIAREQTLCANLAEQLHDRSSRLESRERELQKRLERFTESDAELNEQLAQLRLQVAELAEQKQTLQLAAAELKSRQTELDQRHARLSQREAETARQEGISSDQQLAYEKQRQDIDDARRELAASRQQLDEDQQHLREERTQLEQMRAGISQAAEQLRRQRDELRAAEQQLHSVAESNAESTAASDADAGANIDVELAQVAAERRDLDQQAARIASLQRDLMVQRQDLSQAREQLVVDRRDLEQHRHLLVRREQLDSLARCNLRAWRDELLFAAERTEPRSHPHLAAMPGEAPAATDGLTPQRLQEREQELSVLQATLEQQMAEFELQGGELIELKRELDQRFDNVDRLADEMTARQEALDAREAELKERESHLRQRETRLEHSLAERENRRQLEPSAASVTPDVLEDRGADESGSSIAALFGITDADRSRLESEHAASAATVGPRHSLPPESDLSRDDSSTGVEQDSPMAASDGEDVDIQAYMLRLLSENSQRVKPNSKPGSSAELSKADSPVVAAGDFVTSHPADPEFDASADSDRFDAVPAEADSAIASRTRMRMKPEVSEEAARADLKNLRDVANASARMAVTSSTRKRVRVTLITRTALLVITGGISAGIVALRLWTNTVLMFIGWSCGVVSLVCLYELWRGLMQIRRAKKLGRLQDPSFDPYRQILSSRLADWVLQRLPGKRDRSE